MDAQSSQKFINNYQPKRDILLIQIWWGLEKDSFFLIPLEVQEEIFKKFGKNNYLNLPKAGTNPRGVEFNRLAIEEMLKHPKTLKIKIKWEKGDLKYDVYERWVEYWGQD